MDDDTPPHQDAPAAVFSEGEEPTYALGGEIIHITDEAGVTTQHLLVGRGLTLPVEEDFLPVFEFFATPRSESQANEWLEWAGAPSGFLKQMVKRGRLVRIDTSTSMSAAKSLKGLRLSAQSTPGEQESNGFVGVMSQESAEEGYSLLTVSPELATLLWGNDEGLDIPTAIKKLAKASDQSRESVARRVLALVPMLLEHGLARLEWLRVPKLQARLPAALFERDELACRQVAKTPLCHERRAAEAAGPRSNRT